MKRRIALFMVLAMLVSLVPMNVFAASENTVSNVPKVSDDYNGWVTGAFNTSTPMLKIEEKSIGEFGVSIPQTFRLKLTNAEWKDASATTMAANDTASIAGATTATYTKLSDTEMEVILGNPANAAKTLFSIPMVCEVVAAGDISVTVDARDSKLTGGTYVFATAGSGDTSTTVSSVKSFADSVTLDTIQIDESKIGSLPVKTAVKMVLPSGFKWDAGAAVETFGGGFVGATATAFGYNDSDKRELLVYIDAPDANNARGSVFLSGLKVIANSDAKVGDVAVDVKQFFTGAYTGKVTEQSVVMAKYASYDVTVKALADPLTIYAGDMDSSSASAQDMNKLVEMTVKEEVAGSWLPGRRTVFEFPNTVKILGYDVTKADKVSVSVEGATSTNSTGYVAINNKNLSKIEMIHTKTGAATDKMEMKVKFYVSVDASYVGDVAVKVYGSAMTKENSVVLGKVIAPVAMTSSKKDVKIGLQNQPIADIVITEPAKGVWDSKSDGSEYLDVKLPAGFVWKTVPTVKVTKGDVTLITADIKDVTDQTLRIPVKYSSTVASELTLTGGTVTLDRTLPEGEFKLKIGGTSVVDNSATAADWCRFDSSNVVSFVNFNVITPAPGETKSISKVVFTIDAKEYMVGDVKKEMDAAPFIQNGRTMLPVRYLANALNINDNMISWVPEKQAVTILNGTTTVSIVIGQSYFTVNGAPVSLDAPAQLVNDRTYLPFKAICVALTGKEPKWDEATRTVTLE